MDSLKLYLCSQEPIHVPGSIQPHGLLLVLDTETGLVLEMAGDPQAVLGDNAVGQGASVAAVLEGRLAALLPKDGRELGSEPIHLGDLQAGPGHPPLTVTAHRVAGRTVVEIEPAGPSSSARAVLSFVRASVERMNGASGLEGACRSIVADVRQVTGYDRVMIYQFLEDGSGSVIAEHKADNLPAFLHHRYPASDIPSQARELYRRSPIRVIPDVAYVPAPLVPTGTLTTMPTLDMSHCTLRSVSPVHIQYLKNMGVGASMSVSILKKGELWGLIACHHGGPRPVSFESREVCRHLGQTLSQYIEARDEAEENSQKLELGRARDLFFTELAGASDPKAFLRERISDVQALIPAHGVVISMSDEIISSKHAPPSGKLAALAEWVLQTVPPSGVFGSDCLSEHYAAAEGFTVSSSGLLAVVLPGDRPVVVLWFRAEQVQEVIWAGNPHAVGQPDTSTGALTPRRSFDQWAETVRGRSRSWSRAEVEAAHLLRARAALVFQEHSIRQLNIQLQAANVRSAALARTDDLTGLANRRALGERLTEEWARVVRYDRSLAAVAIDVDHFKKYNDHFGHQAGDECLRKVAKALRAPGRTTDFPARSGGEEFVILLPETDLAGAKALAEVVRAAIEQLRIPHPASAGGFVTASIGVAATRAGAVGSPEGLLHEADKALYSAKEDGRNRVAVASSLDLS